MTIGDYFVVMNSKIDATISGEPYLALKLWFNMKSGKIISRIWDRTIALGKVDSVSHFQEACVTHFKGRPCIGYPSSIDGQTWQDFVISQTPVPRKISRTCQNVLDMGTNASIKSCQECLKLGNSIKQEESIEKETSFSEKFFEGGAQEGTEMRGIENEHKYSGDDANWSHETNDYTNPKANCQELAHGSSHLDFIDQQTTPKDTTGTILSPLQTGIVPRLENPEDDAIAQNGNMSENKLSFTCEHCHSKGNTITFDRRLDFESHIIKWHGGSPFHKKCDICGKQIKCKVYAKHMWNKHGKKGKFSIQCKFCEKQYSTSSLGSLKEHLFKTHLYGSVGNAHTVAILLKILLIICIKGMKTIWLHVHPVKRSII